MDFETRYKKLNDAQKAAVDHIDGPLMVVAGPGTGKTELLSMRSANILKSTDTLPQNILCLTFTESGASAMRSRLFEIIGTDAYKVAIHTFHSFGSEIINQYGDYFYNNAHFQAASDLNVYEILRGIFEQLDHTNPLASSMNDEYTHLRDTIQVISELKKSGLTSDELLAVIDDNERVIDACERELAAVFANRISKNTKDLLPDIAMTIAKLPTKKLPPGIHPISETLALSISHAVDAANDQDSTKPITAWRNRWLEKNDKNEFVFKDRKRIKKLRALSFIYYSYLLQMQEKELFDFDDMVLRVVHALEVFDDLRFNLQEKYQYIMVDEFQDTNLAQSRLLRSLSNNPVSEGAPNIMVVGDDDQAIYSFQGAEISNILEFRGLYETTKTVTLTDNYRSVTPVLSTARDVITQGSERLETHISELDKTLTAHRESEHERVETHEFSHITEERQWITDTIKNQIEDGQSAPSIAVIARRHHELVALLPYFAAAGVQVNYERRENVLESEVVEQLVLLGSIVHALAEERHDLANALLPKLFAHEAWGIKPLDLWKLSLQASRDRTSWLEVMEKHPQFETIHQWLIQLAVRSITMPLEPFLDILIGNSSAHADDNSVDFISPLFAHFFAEEQLTHSPEKYIRLLDALQAIRSKLRDYAGDTTLKLEEFLEFIELHNKIGSSITTIRAASQDAEHSVHLMTAHKSKGLEFETVYVHGAVDTSWGERVRSRSRAISYPENLPLAPSGDSYDERLRLFFVAMTRAKNELQVTYSLLSDSDKQLQLASFLATSDVATTTHEASTDSAQQLELAEKAWYQPLITAHKATLQEELRTVIESYKLSATHLNAFLDVSRGGPQHFLVHNLLRFPEAMGPNAAYGSAVHRTLQRAHAHLSSSGKRRPVEDLLTDFDSALRSMNMDESDFEFYLKRGTDYLQYFFDMRYDSFSTSQIPELSFASQQSMLGDAHLTGSLDVIDIDTHAKTIDVIDYKTGKPSTSWKGKTDFEKIKLHKYRQQLMFYKLLVENSRDYHTYSVMSSSLDFVEPTPSDTHVSLSLDFDDDELEQFSLLVQAVWKRIVTLDLPDISNFSKDYKGIQAFEMSLLEQ
jgi:DNA helicase II / ATP-dependent DNA helicase PcrA